MTTFADPSTPSGFDLAEHLGALLLIDVLDFRQGLTTSYGVADAIEANIAVLDGAHKGETVDQALIWPKVLVGSLKGNVGKKVLGRLARGQAKPGQSAPWILERATDADRETAAKFVAFQAQQNAKADEPW